MTPTSIVTRSPSSIRYGPGIPCTTTSFGEMQIAFGYPLYPAEVGIPSRSRMNVSAAASSSSVVMPGAISEPTCAIVSATSAPAAAMRSISRALLRMITG